MTAMPNHEGDPRQQEHHTSAGAASSITTGARRDGWRHYALFSPRGNL